jgi:hypothetical protein
MIIALKVNGKDYGIRWMGNKLRLMDSNGFLFYLEDDGSDSVKFVSDFVRGVEGATQPPGGSEDRKSAIFHAVYAALKDSPFVESIAIRS